MIERVPHNKDKVWIQQFDQVNKSTVAKRYYLDTSSLLAYTVKVSLDDINNEVIVELPTKPASSLNIFFGQFITPIKNLQLLKNVYFDFDISINPANKMGSFSSNIPMSNPLIIVDGESLSSFVKREGVAKDVEDDFSLTLPSSFYKISIGYSSQQNIPRTSSPLSHNEMLVTDPLADIGEECFTWLEIVNNKIKAPSTKSSTYVLDYKLELDTIAIRDWILSKYSSKDLETLLKTFKTDALDFTLLMYPPVLTSMQLEDIPAIVNPQKVLNERLVKEVSFTVPRSLVKNSQKMFEVLFEDTVTGVLIYKADSLNNKDDFTIIGKKVSVRIEDLELQNSIFEPLSGIAYPTNQFNMLYKIPSDLVKFLANHLKYKITVRVTDLTSERNNNGS